jgi:hypothetical protein
MDTSKINEDTLWWVSGQIDGDGCCWAATTSLNVNISKSIKSASTVLLFQKLFGGSVYWKIRNTPTSEAQCEWRLSGAAAIEFCELIKDYTQVKKEQFTLGSQWPLYRAPYSVVFADNTSVVVENQIAAAGQMGCTRGYLGRSIRKNGGSFTNKLGDTASPVTGILEEKVAIGKRLRELKVTVDSPVTRELPLAYYAGFVDSEGCVSMCAPFRFMFSVSQKYRAILDSFKVKFGGGVSANTTREKFLWSTCGPETRAALTAMLPYLFEKKLQAQIGLRATKATWLADKAALDSTKAVDIKRGRPPTVTTKEQLEACRIAAEKAMEDVDPYVQIGN